LGPACDTRSELLDIVVPADAAVVSRQIVEVRLPPSALIILIEKGSVRFVPCGSTVLEGGDKLLILADTLLADEVRTRFSVKMATKEEENAATQ
jgi:cell volume regulation protein A